MSLRDATLPSTMRFFIPLLLGVLAPVLATATTPSLDGLYALVERVAPSRLFDFEFALMQGEGDSFTVTDSPDSDLAGSILISCTTTSACARGLYSYVRLC